MSESTEATESTEGPEPARLPDTGVSAAEVIARAKTARAGDINWRSGRAFSLVYNADDPELEALQHQVVEEFLHDNALNPFAYPNLQAMETDIIAMAAHLFGAPADAGSLTSGGTESIFLAVHTLREVGRDRGIESPNLVLPSTAHPAFTKACGYLGITEIRVPVGKDLRADVGATTAVLDDQTIGIVGSAPCYPYGTMDPIEALASVAAERDIPCHVDACLGGWLLPFWAELGEPVPAWDMRVPGVTSISADIHKYGYTIKGASVVVYRSRDLLAKQWFLYDKWPGGLYGSATTAGTRPAPPIAAAWATLTFLGHEGLLEKARVVRDTTRAFRSGIEAIDGLEVTGEPDMSVFQFTSNDFDINAVGDVMDDRGWHLDRQQGGLHLMMSPGHAHVVESFLEDLADAVATHGKSLGKAATYGGIAG